MMSYLWIVLFCSLLAGGASAEDDAVDPLLTPAPDNATLPDDVGAEVSAEEEDDKEPTLPTEDTLEGDIASNPDQPSASPEIDLTETSDVPLFVIPVKDPSPSDLPDTHDGMPGTLNIPLSALPDTDDDVTDPSDVPHSANPVEDPVLVPFGIPLSDLPDTYDGMPGTLNIPLSALPDTDDDVTDPSDVPHSANPVEDPVLVPFGIPLSDLPDTHDANPVEDPVLGPFGIPLSELPDRHDGIAGPLNIPQSALPDEEHDVTHPVEIYPIKNQFSPQPEEPDLVSAVDNSLQTEMGQTVGAPARVGAGQGSSQSKGTQPGSLAGIVIGVVLAVMGAIAVYVAYQRKALCFKNRQEADPEAGRKADTAEAQLEPQVLSNLLNSSQQ
ncbi:histone-lysine N-methyltransferase 2D-like [Thalassophryne amazonica]|uniref:histone-lysine N-methyltransferase 2D-like n=1 Tax=Thalassophryne amazonica TaxID=390379 RepID=UPI00147166A1|nr:histone-lysine N-methyltransferase 2D-like [Thalassophryne amazonica]